MKLTLVFVISTIFTTIAYAQPYDPGYGRPPPRYDRDDRDYDRRPPPPPPYDRGPPGYDHPPPRMVCFIEPPPPFPTRRCPTRPGPPGSPCHCGGLPIEGHRDFDRRY